MSYSVVFEGSRESESFNDMATLKFEFGNDKTKSILVREGKIVLEDLIPWIFTSEKVQQSVGHAIMHGFAWPKDDPFKSISQFTGKRSAGNGRSHHRGIYCCEFNDTEKYMILVASYLIEKKDIPKKSIENVKKFFHGPHCDWDTIKDAFELYQKQKSELSLYKIGKTFKRKWNELSGDSDIKKNTKSIAEFLTHDVDDDLVAKFFHSQDKVIDKKSKEEEK